MTDVRINGKRFPALQAIDQMKTLVQRLETYGSKEGMALTEVYVNGIKFDIDQEESLKLRFDVEDIVEARLETPHQMAFESLLAAQEMAELLIFDIKVATLQLWDKTRLQEKSLDTLLKDTNLFLSLGARPIELLGVAPETLPQSGQRYLKLLNEIADHLEDATLLAVAQKQKESCQALLTRVLPSIERWLSYAPEFANILELNQPRKAAVEQIFAQP